VHTRVATSDDEQQLESVIVAWIRTPKWKRQEDPEDIDRDR